MLRGIAGGLVAWAVPLGEAWAGGGGSGRLELVRGALVWDTLAMHPYQAQKNEVSNAEGCSDRMRTEQGLLLSNAALVRRVSLSGEKPRARTRSPLRCRAGGLLRW